jgi:DNA-binding MltR family transcriptional regulator
MTSKYLTRKRAYAKWATQDEIYQKLYDEESDRAVALIAGGFLEDQLAITIEHFFTRIPEEDSAKLFHGLGPLSSFYAKILLGFAMGIYGPKTREDIETISHIRNEFAHNSDFIDFDHSHILNLCKNLHLPKKISDERRRIGNEEMKKQGRPIRGRNRNDYVAAVAIIHQGLFISRWFAPPDRQRMQAMIRD